MKPKQAGFTLVELLVVIAIIGVLIALLLPAVQQAREAARRLTCRSQLKNFGLALHNYHDVHGTLPPGLTASANGGWSWGAMLLPFIEQSNIHDAIDFKLSPSNGSNATAILSTIPIANCPSDQAPKTNDELSLPNQATTSYCASGGANMYTPNKCSGVEEGVFYHNSKRAFRDFTDGSSNSIVVGEVVWRVTPYMSGNAARNLQHYYGGQVTVPWYHNGDPCGVGSDDNTYRRTFAIIRNAGYPMNVYHAAADTYYDNAHHAFGSHHPGGAHFLFGDASVHFLSEHIDSKTDRTWWPNVTDGQDDPSRFTGVYQALNVINDGNVVAIP
ncbi:DUF1559 domain-containing protein [Blastopirellula sp. J2-11]|uniref:DUF1559 domain-containing protein n=1 Tax=Blastopirellula sp. J2-11 TaxID=2943192 RepID=UPI002905B78F|nr:DUF1559 domain-containing protein [Blastopirellula sp. J2-11]